jgi:hypothetical protein
VVLLSGFSEATRDYNASTQNIKITGSGLKTPFVYLCDSVLMLLFCYCAADDNNDEKLSDSASVGENGAADTDDVRDESEVTSSEHQRT